MNYLASDIDSIVKTNMEGINNKAAMWMEPDPDLVGADTLIGTDVYNPRGEHLGDIREIMLDSRSGEARYGLLSFGGFLAVSEKLFAVPWEAFTFDALKKRFVLDVEKDRLEEAAGVDPATWSSLASQSWRVCRC